MYIDCVGMMRSGSTLQYNIVAEILELKEIGKRLGWEHHEEFHKIKEKYVNEKYNVFKNHFLTDEIESELKQNDGSILMYVYRDIRDVCISIMDKENKTFEQVFNSKVLHNAIEQYYKITNSSLKKYIQSYEVMFLNTKREIKEVARFLNVELTTNELETIYSKISFESQKENIEKYKENSEYISKGSQKFNADTLLHLNHIKDGGIAKYKQRLSKSQIKQLEDEFGEWLQELGYRVEDRQEEQEPLRRYYSQFGDDYLLWKFFDFKPKGLCIDIGAFDGKYISNTYSFEMNGWDCICVEPIPEFYELCLKNRPNSKCYNYALSDNYELNEVDFYTDETGLYSSCKFSEQDLEFIEKCHKIDNIEFKGLSKIKVKNCTLNSVLEEAYPKKNPNIDFISFDVEGLELSVLKGFNLIKYSPRIMIIEANDEDAKKSIIEYMEEQGYIFTLQNAVNLFFTKNSFDYNKLKNIDLNCVIEKQDHPIREELSLKKYKYGVQYIHGFESTFLLNKKNQELEQKQKVIEQKNNELKEKNQELEQKQKVIEQKNNELKEKNQELEQKQKVIEQKNNELKEKNQELEQKQKVIEQKNNELKEKNQELEQKQKVIEQKNNELKEKNQELEQLLKSIEKVTNISVKSSPLKKYNAYKSLVLDYNNIIKNNNVTNS